jgi:S1-C subfamily serine protease
VGDDVVVAGHGGRKHALRAKLIAKREFAGYWEYVLDEALFTAPAHPHWSGAALIGGDGRLVGLGSLMVQEELGGRTVQGNMMVPIDLLEPILEDLLKLGRAKRAARPWLGVYATEVKGHVVVSGLAGGGPAERAGVQVGDIVIEVAGARVGGLADLFRKIWILGAAGVEVPMTLVREGSVSRLRLSSIDRQDLLKKPSLH